MDDVIEAENLRADALGFATGVNRNADVSADQQVIWFGLTFDYTQFLDEVRLRFLDRPDGGHNTPAILAELVRTYRLGISTRSRLHADACVLFIGHADLFNRFERLRFMYDGREGTRRQIREWRNSVRRDIKRAVDVESADFLLAIGKLMRLPTPERLDGRNLDFIKKTCFPEGSDLDHQFEVDVVVNLVLDPASVLYHVFPTLEEKQERFRQVDRFLANYFAQIALGGV